MAFNKNDVSDLVKQGNELQYKFINALTSVGLASLALSIQFTPELGNLYPYILVSGWVTLFISGGLGGWRMMYAPTFLWMNAKWMEENENKKAYSTGPVHRSDGTEFTEAQMLDSLMRTEERMKKLKVKTDRLNWFAPRLFNLQVISLVLGLFLVGLFTTLNFLKKDIKQPLESSRGLK